MSEDIFEEPALEANMQRLSEYNTKSRHTLELLKAKWGERIVNKYYMRSLFRSLNLSLQDDLSKHTRDHFLMNFYDIHAVSAASRAAELPQTIKKVNLLPFNNGQKKKTLVLDLDETLVHCLQKGDGSEPDITIELKLTNSVVKVRTAVLLDSYSLTPPPFLHLLGWY